jgi:hypothetical protein
MAKRTRKTTSTDQASLEDRMVAFAEQVGWIVGAAQTRTEGWLEHGRLAEQLARIRDEASSLLAQLPSLPRAARGRTASSRAARPAPVDLVHAPGKRHRKPLPQQHGVKHSNQQVVKAKIADMSRSYRRGAK